MSLVNLTVCLLPRRDAATLDPFEKIVNKTTTDVYAGHTQMSLRHALPQVPEVQRQTEEQRASLLAEHPVDRLYQLKRKCNGCQEEDLSLLEGELVALLEDTDPLGSSSRWLVHTGGQCTTRACWSLFFHAAGGKCISVAPFLDTRGELRRCRRSSVRLARPRWRAKLYFLPLTSQRMERRSWELL